MRADVVLEDTGTPFVNIVWNLRKGGNKVSQEKTIRFIDTNYRTLFYPLPDGGTSG